MPLFMDVHTIDGGVATDDVAKAHQADLPSAEAASTVHREAHGLVADSVFPVQEGS